jgi:hypothetical protein
LKFGISGGLFYDTGLVWYQKDPFTPSSRIYGYGFGLHLHLPYINVLRLELAFNAMGDTQFIVDLDVDI